MATAKRKLDTLEDFFLPLEVKKARVDEQTQPAHVAIIGTAGRMNDKRNKDLTTAHFEWMVDSALKTLVSFGLDPSETHLISGGAAWADHVAVELFLRKKVAGLTLYAPCAFAEASFVDTGSADWRTNPGKTSNYYHRLFSEKIGRNSLTEIATACARGAVLDTSGTGFHSRNSAIAARATHMIAFTWSEEGKPTDGGTLDTWKKCALAGEFKVHVSLKEVSLFS